METFHTVLHFMFVVLVLYWLSVVYSIFVNWVNARLSVGERWMWFASAVILATVNATGVLK